MRCIHSARWVMVLIGLATALLIAADSRAEDQARAPVVITYDPLIDLHHWVRAATHNRAEAWDQNGFAESVELAKAVQEHQRSSLDWGTIDSLITRSGDLDVAIERARTVEPPRGLTGEPEAYRAAAVAYLESLKPFVEPFAREEWLDRRPALESLADWLTVNFIERPEVLEWHAEWLSLEMPDPPVTLVLVTNTGWPGGFTHNDGTGRGLSYVELELGERGLVYETVLHELTHALEVQNGRNSVPSRIRRGLLEAGIDRRDEAIRSGWHTIYFIQSAMTTRRFLDPEHVPYGVARTLYERTGPIAEIELRAWEAHHAGELTVDEAIEQIVKRVVASLQDEGD